VHLPSLTFIPTFRPSSSFIPSHFQVQILAINNTQLTELRDIQSIDA
jgi:hypothetical protein